MFAFSYNLRSNMSKEKARGHDIVTNDHACLLDACSQMSQDMSA